MSKNPLPILRMAPGITPNTERLANATKSSTVRPPKILFVNPPTIPYNLLVQGLSNRYSEFEQVIAMPMGILYLSGVLERDFPGVEILIVDLAREVREYNASPEWESLDLEQLTARVLAEQVPQGFVPDYVGISILFSTAHKSSLHIAGVVKNRWANTPILIGGVHATSAVPQLLECPDVDYVCRGEAESIISQFTTAIIEGGDIQQIPGIIDRDQFARGEGSQSAPLIHDLDTIPFPAWHLIPMTEYLHVDHGRSRRIDEINQDGEATIVTTRGCPFRCTFCASWTTHGREMRYRSVENVLEELTQLKERFHVSTVIPEDDLFTVKKSRILALCEAVTQKFSGSLYFEFPNGLSVATLDEEVIHALSRMGMRVANIAVESGSAYVQKHIIKKNCNLDRARSVIQICRDSDITVRAYFILGFPGETREQMQETIDFSASLPLDWTIFNIAEPLVGTEMYEQLMEGGQIGQSFDFDEAFHAERTFDTPEIGAQDLKDLAYTSNIRINFFENYNQRNGRYERALGNYRDVLTHHPGHLIAQYCVATTLKQMGDIDGWKQAIDRCREMLSQSNYTMAKRHYREFKNQMTGLNQSYGEPVVSEPNTGTRPVSVYTPRQPQSGV